MYEVAGKPVRVTHPEKVLFPHDDITKAELLSYYLQVAPFLIPHIRSRPLTLKAFPHGIAGRPYYRRNLSSQTPSWLSRVELEDGSTPVVENEADLLWVGNQDSIELHPWLSRSDDLLHPDLLVIDLDPGPHVSWNRVCEAAVVVKELLSAIGLRTWPKTSGNKGMHILSGLEPRHRFQDVHTWAIGVARVLVEHRQDLFSVDYAKARREDKVLVDHAQIGYGKSTVSIYSVRPLAGAPVSTPLSWEEVSSGQVAPADFNIRTLPERLAKHGDLAADLVAYRQVLPLV